MNHPAEIKIHKYLSGLKSEDSVMSPEVIDQITSDVREALTKQFVDKRSNKFTLRMSNIGRSTVIYGLIKTNLKLLVNHQLVLL